MEPGARVADAVPGLPFLVDPRALIREGCSQFSVQGWYSQGVGSQVNEVCGLLTSPLAAVMLSQITLSV